MDLFDRKRLEQLGGAVLLVAVALLLRYPTSFDPGLVPHDTNSDLHILVARALSQGEFGHVAVLDFPHGVDVRLVAVPMLLLSLPLQFLGHIQAFHIAVVLWLVLNGLAVQWCGERLGLSRARALSLAMVTLLGGQTLSFLGNGQFENVVPAALGLGLVAAHEPRLRQSAAFLAAALLLAGFSSPYQAIVVVLLCLGASAVDRGPRHTAALLGVACLMLIPVALYYSGATAGPLQPAPGGIADPLEFTGLSLQTRGVSPIVGFPYSGVRLEPPIAIRSIGWVLPITGLLSLALLRRRAMAFGVAGVLVFLAAIGPSVAIGEAQVPGPFAVASHVPGLRDMGATFRFATGLTFLAALLALKTRFGQIAALVLPALVAAETFLFSPGVWPVHAAPRGDVVLDEPVGFWPAPPSAASDCAEWVAVAYGVPVAWAPSDDGKMSAWIETLEDQGIEKIVVYDGPMAVPEALDRCLVSGEGMGAAARWYWLRCREGASNPTTSRDLGKNALKSPPRLGPANVQPDGSQRD